MKIVGVGGGHGLAKTLRAARLYADDISAVVTVADDGGSSGRLTRELGIPPPGDIRNCLVALAVNEELASAFQHRFAGGMLTGHTVGNLVIAALTERSGNFADAVLEAGSLLGAVGSVFPATQELVRLGALVEGGFVQGQVAVAETDEPIQSLQLDPPEPAAHPPAVDSILQADQVILGPGSLFTSIIATLLVPGIAQALRDTDAQRVFVCNTRMQKGETENLDVRAHVQALIGHVGRCVDVAVAQDPVLLDDGVDLGSGLGDAVDIRVVHADVAKPDGGHLADELAKVLEGLAK